MADPPVITLHSFPSREFIDGDDEEIDIENSRTEYLRQLCVAFRLKPANKRQKSYQEALKAFSLNRNDWQTWRVGDNVRRHKGPRSGAVSKARGAFQSVSGTVAPTRRDGKEKLMGWAQIFQKALDTKEDTPKILPHSKSLSNMIYETLNEMEGHGLINSQDSPGRVAQLALLNLLKTLAEHTPICHHPIATPTDGSHPVPKTSPGERYIHADGATEPDLTPPCVPAPLVHAPPTPCVYNPRPDPEIVSSPKHDLGPLDTHYLVLAKTTLSYTSRHLPDYIPVGITLLADNLDRLWDDAGPRWNGESPLIINSTAIALKYWPYIHWPSQTWGKVSKTWKRWKVLMTEYQSLGHEGYSAKWLQGGAKLSSSHIIKILEDCARKEDIELASTARLEFGDNFSQHFAYQKQGKTHICSTPFSIAQRYRSLKNIRQDSTPLGLA